MKRNTLPPAVKDAKPARKMITESFLNVSLVPIIPGSWLIICSVSKPTHCPKI